MGSSSSDMPGLARLTAAVREIVADVADRRLSAAVAVARGVERLRALMDDEPATAERIRRENEAALAEMAKLGNKREAAMIVAGRRTDDPHRRVMLAQRFRQARRRRRQNETH